jgi:hypothetical protein
MGRARRKSRGPSVDQGKVAVSWELEAGPGPQAGSCFAAVTLGFPSVTVGWRKRGQIVSWSKLDYVLRRDGYRTMAWACLRHARCAQEAEDWRQQQNR